MICSQCGAANSDEAVFCQKCGSRLETTGQHEPTLYSPLPASPYEQFSTTVPGSSESTSPPPPPSIFYKSTSNPYELEPALRSHSNRRYLIVIAVLVALLVGGGGFELGQVVNGHQPRNPNPVPPMAIASSTPSLPVVYYVVLNANQGFPGVDTGIHLRSGDRLTITASGTASHGGTGPSLCNDEPTNPDGISTLNGSPCNSWYCGSGSVYPSAPIGTLLARIGQLGTISSSGWFVVGSKFSSTVVMGGELYLIYDDCDYADNSGSYQVTITVEQG